ncbi:MAG: hypothetical protein Q8Q28_18370 [Pseudomonadota bacterium]|nr:hypothetical protein [Pseudomonadota bacterium]
MTAIQQQFFPPIIGIEGLSTLINKTPSTILADRCRAPHRVPPACTPTGSKQPLWVLEDVIAWLRSYREQQATPPAPSAPPPTPRRRGRPTKREQIERAAILAAGEGA